MHEIIEEVRDKSDPGLAVFRDGMRRDDETDKALQIAAAMNHFELDLQTNFARAYFAQYDDDFKACFGDAAGSPSMKALVDEDRREFIRRYLFARDWFVKGKAEGEAAGDARGRAAILLRQLQLKFGPLPEAVTARVQSAPIAELDSWAERVLSATSLDEALR